MDIYQRIELLMSKAKEKPADLSRATGISTGLLTQWKQRKQKPSADKLAIVAEHYKVSLDYFLGNDQEKTPALNKKDERDIAKKLEETLDMLNNNQDGLMFDGEPLDEETQELLRASLKNQFEVTKKLAKQKYTPNKYRK